MFNPLIWRVGMWAAIITALLTSAAWIYVGLKREGAIEERYRQEQALYRAQHKEDLEAIAALSTAIGAMKEGYETLERDRGRLNKELQKVKKDAEAARYLGQPVPNGVRDVLKNSHCLQVPGSCGANEPNGSGVPGDQHN